MPYNNHPITENNVNREKELAKKEFALTFFPSCLFLIYRIPN